MHMASTTYDHAASDLVKEIATRSGLSQAELARRSGINAYLHGSREPAVGALYRIAVAGGMELDLRPRREPVDPKRASRLLIQVLGLAEALPYKPRPTLDFPPLRDRVARPE